MKKALFFLIFLVIGGFAAKAQYVPVDGPLSYKWGGIYDANGHRLSRDGVMPIISLLRNSNVCSREGGINIFGEPV